MKSRIAFPSLFALILVCLMFAGCKPYNTPEFKEIQSNETAFAVPLEGANLDKQVKFESVQYLDQRKVAAKRYQIPKRWVQNGRLWFDGGWIPTERVIIVSRSPITVTWNSSFDANGKRQGTGVALESVESIGFALETINITVSIPEEATATYLYNFPQATLDSVLNGPIRSAIVSGLSQRFGRLSLDQCRIFKGFVFREVQKEVLLEWQGADHLDASQRALFDPENNPSEIPVTFRTPTKAEDGSYSFSEKTINMKVPFTPMGIEALEASTSKGYGVRINNLGLEGGLVYENNDIQEKIDEQFKSENDLIIKQNTFNANQIRRADELRDAENQRAVAEEIAKSQEAYKTIKSLDIALELSKRWNGVLPQFLIAGDSGEKLNMFLPTPTVAQK